MENIYENLINISMLLENAEAEWRRTVGEWNGRTDKETKYRKLKLKITFMGNLLLLSLIYDQTNSISSCHKRLNNVLCSFDIELHASLYRLASDRRCQCLAVGNNLTTTRFKDSDESRCIIHNIIWKVW